ncbi:hypothetical protein [Peribacillus alkalitolerans]|uniref:hypothetical protein n=1 Tax=Peribacillus alkalitolerans TaxID=1550385 RepID=UPI0013D19BEF|nr:hypothetical protein [Peribacillus alkalitolerans]
MKDLYKWSISILAILMLTACGSTEETKKEAASDETVTTEPAGSNTTDDESTTEDNNTDDSTNGETGEGSDAEGSTDSGSETTLPTKKELDVHVEGQVEKRPATLQESELGYYIYVLEKFKLEAEEPNKDILSSTYDESFFARIEKLSSDSDLNEVKKNLLDSYKEKAIEEDPTKLYLKSFHDAEFYITTKEDKDVPTSVIYVGKKFNGHPYVLTIFLPSKEAAEGLGPNIWAMLESIQNKK